MKRGIIACSVAAIVSLAAALWPQTLRTSPEAQLKMAKYEDCRKTPYYCPAGVLTVGMGSTSNVQNREYAEREIAERWVNDLFRAEKCVNREFNGTAAPQRVFEALTDGAFNVGCGGLGWYTNKKGQKVQNNNLAQCAGWQLAGRLRATHRLCQLRRKSSAGLVKRREEFRDWCLSEPELKGAK
ncbi:Phage-related lysozyme (muraminidase) [Yokenella regensburgei]|uniref:glycoside hydrolase family protein n=1 Tax=Yokenella regensburgei TaxID=158877 RepID=UPI000E041989|nr:Phage-related lysozyme (muraminidase) [Yokenella regensburgei]